MRTDKQVRAKIERVTEDSRHVLDCGPATAEVNAPRAFMQLAAVTALEQLYWFIEEQRPRFECDNNKKTNT